MKKLGLLLIFAGICTGILWPWAQINLLGNKIDQLEFSQFRAGNDWEKSVNLSLNNNPVRLRFKAYYLLDGKRPPLKIPVKIVITDADGTLLTGFISFTAQGRDQGPELGEAIGSQMIEFNVLNAGEHKIALTLAPNDNDGGIAVPDIDSVKATIVANAPALRDDFKVLAVLLSLSGFYMLVRSRRKKSGSPSQPKRRWGRGS